MTKPLEKKSQTELLKDHFETSDSISGIEAQALYRIRALPRRILDLIEDGMHFRKVRKTDPTGQRYVRYYHVEAGPRGMAFADR